MNKEMEEYRRFESEATKYLNETWRKDLSQYKNDTTWSDWQYSAGSMADFAAQFHQHQWRITAIEFLENKITAMSQCIADSQGEQDWGREIKEYQNVIEQLKGDDIIESKDPCPHNFKMMTPNGTNCMLCGESIDW